MPSLYIFESGALRAIDAPAARPLRWAAWRPDGAFALIVGNRGEAWRFDGRAFERLDTRSAHNLRGAGWSPDGSTALLAGNRGAVLRYDGSRFEELPSPATENLRRVAWSPDGASALVIGNGGAVLRYDAARGALDPVPGDRAHTLRAIAWRPDGAYALVGAYASRFAGYPRPHALYRCDGRYLQALLTTDDEDDCVALSWRPGAQPARALALVVSYGERRPGGEEPVANKLVEYDGSGFTTTPLEAPAALLGAAWSPESSRGDAARAVAPRALICGERGALFTYDGASLAPLETRTNDNLVGPFWHPSGATALFLKGPDEKVYTV